MSLQAINMRTSTLQQLNIPLLEHKKCPQNPCKHYAYSCCCNLTLLISGTSIEPVVSERHRNWSRLQEQTRRWRSMGRRVFAEE